MPFESDKQRAYLYANKPEVAKKFANHGNVKTGGRKKCKGTICDEIRK